MHSVKESENKDVRNIQTCAGNHMLICSYSIKHKTRIKAYFLGLIGTNKLVKKTLFELVYIVSYFTMQSRSDCMIFEIRIHANRQNVDIKGA